MDDKNQIKCPCCYSEDYYTQYTVDADVAARELSSSDDEGIISRIEEIIHSTWEKSTANWNLCRACGNGFAEPFVAIDAEYYTITYTGEVFYTPWKWEYEQVYRLIQSFHNMDSQLLEIGAGNGAFVGRMSESLLEKQNILCTEYSEYGINEISSRGIRCEPKNIFELKTGENLNRFDYICMFQVFEHMDDLDEVFQTINRLSKPGSNLFIAVPSHKHREFYSSHGKNLDFPPGHISCFTPKSITKLSGRHGWKLVSNDYQRTRKRFQTYTFLTDRLGRHEKLDKKLSNLSNDFIRRIITNFILAMISIFNVRALLKLNLGRYGVAQLFHLQRELK